MILTPKFENFCKFTVHCFLIAVNLFCLIFFSTSCKNVNTPKTNAKLIPDISIQKGKALAAMYCVGCHLAPDPTLLTKRVWEEGELPYMGPRLGIFKYKGINYPHSLNDPLLAKNYYPKEPQLTNDEWQNIIDYYIASSPDILPVPKRATLLDDGDKFFSVSMPDKISPKPPVTCMIKIDSSEKQRKILTGDVFNKFIATYTPDLKLKDTIGTGGPITDISFLKNKIIACNTGVLNPNNGKFGKIQEINISASGKKILSTKPLMDSLMRPVQILAADLNKDGRIDYVVCEFGHLNGALSWLENKGNNKFERHQLKYQPGALKIIINDYNNDGLPDIWVLFAQGNEEISLFTNKGGGKFEETELLSFQPQWGSSSFDLADINNDGHLDIVYTCGDNADYSKILKPFHGVYVYLNDGQNNFKQSYFYPINGAFKVLAADFDGDGKKDLAVISFFADYENNPNEGFIYFVNKGNNNFEPHALSKTNVGRWITMDVGDMDGDGKPDIVLGNFSVAPSFLKSKTDWKAGPQFMVLKNICLKR